jgi:exopolyphosphatase/guanosine-5'-triphosphate,3'-diphosphate pyrophosphatase
VLILCVLLRLAENLDRSQTGNVHHVSLAAVDATRVTLQVHAVQDCHIEIWGVQQHLATFEKIFRRRLDINVVTSDVCSAPTHNGHRHQAVSTTS